MNKRNESNCCTINAKKFNSAFYEEIISGLLFNARIFLSQVWSVGNKEFLSIEFRKNYRFQWEPVLCFFVFCSTLWHHQFIYSINIY